MSLTKASFSMISGTPLNVVDFGAISDGDYSTGAGTDNLSAFTNALAELSSTGGTALYIPAGIYKISDQIEIPDGVSVYGDGQWSSIIFCPTSFSDTTGFLKVGGTASGYPTQISNLGIIAETGGCTGFGLVSNKNGVFVNNVWINGFGLGAEFNQTDNFISDFAVELCTIGIRITQSDVQVESGTFYSCNEGLVVSNLAAVSSGSVIITAVRATSCLFTGFNIDSAKSVEINGCAAYHDNASKFLTAGLYIQDSTRISANGFQAHIPGLGSSTGIGLLIENSSNVSISGGIFQGWLDGVQITGASTSQVSVSGVVSTINSRNAINVNGGDRVVIVGCQASFNGASGGSDSGILTNNSAAYAQHTIIGNTCTQAGGGTQEYGINANVTNTTATTILTGNSCLFNNTTDIVLQGQTQQILVANNIFGTFNDLAGPPAIASATTITIPAGASVLKVTGTTNITGINTTSSQRRTVTLIFNDVLTVSDGSNLKLAGNFVTSADDTLTLYCDGTNWFELSRSVN